MWVAEDVCMAVISRFGTGGGNTPIVLEDNMQKVTGTLSQGAHPGSYNGQDAYNDMLIAEKRNVFCDAEDKRVQGIGSGILSEAERPQGCDRSNYRGGQMVYAVGNGQLHQVNLSDRVGALNTMHDQQMILSGGNMSRVRRLTPMECERLQGFPDGWTDLGEWTDSQGKKHKTSDSNRYKSLGNSIALPFWFYLLRRIAAQYERPATLGSLFSGIGGFELCWLRCNGEGTVLWTSEVDEFCYAVLKERFG